MSIQKIPERYSIPMRTYSDLCCSRGKYSFTSCDDFMLEALSMMCRARVLGQEGCLILLYHEYKNEAVGGTEENLDFMTIGNNENYVAELLMRVKREGLEILSKSYDEMIDEVGFPATRELQAIQAIANCWVEHSRYARAFLIIFANGGNSPQALKGCPWYFRDYAYDKMIEKAYEKGSDFMKALEASWKYTRWKKTKRPQENEWEKEINRMMRKMVKREMKSCGR